MSNNIKGHCLCGKVSFAATADSNNIGVCHCKMCQRWLGGPMFAVHCGEGVEFSGEEYIQHYASSDWAERAFCKNCGSSLYYRFLQTGEIALAAGLLDNADGFSLNEQIFIEEKPAFFHFREATKEMTGAEVFAAYQASQEQN